MFSISFKVSEEARAEAFKKDGTILPLSCSIAVDEKQLTEDQRGEIVKFGIPVNGASVNIYTAISGTDLDAVFATLKTEKEKRAEAIAKEQDARAEKAREYLAGGVQGVSIPNPGTGDDTLDAACLVEYARRKAENEAYDAARDAEKAAKVEAMKTWAQKNASMHVKDLIEEGFNWQEKAEAEWVESSTPYGFCDVSQIDGYDDYYDVKNPSENAIKVLRETRSVHPSAKLIRVKFLEDGDTTHSDYVQIGLLSPLGNVSLVEKFIEDYAS